MRHRGENQGRQDIVIGDRFKNFLLPLTYARRDLRAGMGGFYIFLICLALGVGAIAGVQSLSRGLVESLHYNGRYILGGDVALRTIYEPATPEQIRFLHDKIGPVTIVMETRAMARRLDEKQASLVELKAVDPFYPLYGSLEALDGRGEKITGHLQDLLLPPPIINGVERDEWGALVEKELLSRLKISVGDWMYVGSQKFQVRGILSKESDRVGGMRFVLAPRVMISGYTFDKTGLKKKGSQVYYDHKILMPYVQTFEDLRAAEKKIAEAFPKAAWQGRDFITASPQVERMVNRLTVFLTLIGLATLLIGGVGVSNAVRSFLESRLPDIATMKCLGGSEKFVFRAYIIQILILATLGILIGLFIGIISSQAAGSLLTAKFELVNRIRVYPWALVQAAAYGYLITLCFSLWPMGRAVKISPAGLFRDTISPTEGRPSPNIILWIVILAQALALIAVLGSTERNLVQFFVVGTAFAFAVFYGYAALIKIFIKRVKFDAFPELRLAVANLHRPGNVSSSVILSLGLGLTVLVAVALVQFNFTRLISDDVAADAPSFFFLDVEPGQRADFKKLVEGEPSARNIVMTPSFRGRVVKVNGKPAEEALVDPNESWVINSDRGITYTAELPAHSRVTEGAWWAADYNGPPVVSIATNVARAFNIGVGAEITVNVLGKDITAKVANIREIDWTSFTMNFAITFAPGPLDEMPSGYLATIVVDQEHEEELQTKIANKFKNITAVRVRDVLAAAQVFIRAIAQAVSISAGVTLAAGTLVLSGGIAAARKRHLYDSIILKVLGATRKRILKVFLLEYGMLGIITVVIAAMLGTAASYGIQRFVMNLDWKFSWGALLGVTTLCLIITLGAGFLGTWRVLQQKPAPYLRNQ